MCIHSSNTNKIHLFHKFDWFKNIFFFGRCVFKIVKSISVFVSPNIAFLLLFLSIFLSLPLSVSLPQLKPQENC